MKKAIAVLSSLVILALFIGTGVFLYNKSQEKPIVYDTDSPIITDIFQKTVATGKIIPRREIEIKSQVSGVVHTIYVNAGQKIKKGDLIAKIEIIPNMERLNGAETQLETAKLNFKNARQEHDRQKKLFAEKLIPEFEFNKYLLEYELKKEALSSAESNLAIIREGASKQADKVANLVKSTIDGLVLDIPVKEGTFVTETNTFNAGTTIASIANMQDMIFEGNIDESEVGKIKEGMPLNLKIGALDDTNYSAKLEYISPKGFDDNGTIKFQIRAAVELQKSHFLRAGYSANAEIILDSREQVLALNERLLQFKEEKAYVEIETSPQEFEKKEVKTGLSDGINIEILSGIAENNLIKIP